MESMRSQDSSSIDASSTSAPGGTKTIAKLGSFVSCEWGVPPVVFEDSDEGCCLPVP